MSKTKYSPVTKISAVERWLSGDAGQRTIAKSLRVSLACFQQWIQNYECMGAEAFMMAGHKQSFSVLRKKLAS